MKKKLILSLILSSSVSFLSCLDLGISGGDDDTPTNSDTNTISYLAYKASLDLVDPENASTLQIETKPLNDYWSVSKLKSIDATNYTYQDLHRYLMIYITEEDGDTANKNGGKIYKVSLEKGTGTPSKVQVTNLTNACRIKDWNEDTISGIFYTTIVTAGADGDCDTSDDEEFFINSNMDGNTSPISMENKIVVTSWKNEPFGAKQGFIIYDTSTNELKKCDTNLNNCNVLKTASSYYNLPNDEKTNMIYLCVDGTIQKMKGSDNSLTDTGTSCDVYGSDMSADDKYIFFISYDSGSNVYYLMRYSKSDDSIENLYTFSTYPSGNSIIQGNTIDNVIVFNNDNSELAAIDKGTGDYKAIQSVNLSSSEYYESFTIIKDKYLYNYEDSSRNDYACYWKDGDSSPTCKDNSYWINILYSQNGSLDFTYGNRHDNTNPDIYKLLLSNNEKNIYAVDIVDLNNPVSIGTLPDGYDARFRTYQVGKYSLISAANENVSGEPNDVFLIDIENKRIEQITKTDDKSEEALD